MRAGDVHAGKQLAGAQARAVRVGDLRAGATLPVDLASVGVISAIDDPVRRNLWITVAYHDLGERFSAALGNTDATWCTFGVWASATAGASIRREQLPRVLVELFEQGGGHQDAHAALNRRLRLGRIVRMAKLLGQDDVLAAFDRAIDRVAEEVGAGNKLVFDELGPLLVGLVERLEAPGALGPGERDQVLDDLGVVAADAAAPEPGLLLGAFRSWLDAFFDADDLVRAQRVLAGNVQAVLHEQQRLQPAIQSAIQAGAGALAQALEAAVPFGERLTRLVTRAMGRVARRQITWFGGELDRLWDLAATHTLMVLSVPGGPLHLDLDLPTLSDGTRFPGVLAALDDPDVVRLFERLDRTGGTGIGCAANDWTALDDRMCFIVNLFRSRQRDPSLRVPPFTAAQLEALAQGVLPPPPLLPI